MRQVGTHSLTFVHSCCMHIIVHVLTHTHPHTLTPYTLHIAHCTLHITHYTLHDTHTYTDNTWHARGTVHCTTDPQAQAKKTLFDRNSIGHCPIGSHTNRLILSKIVGVCGCMYVVMSYKVLPLQFFFFSKIILSTFRFLFFFAPLLLLESSPTIL